MTIAFCHTLIVPLPINRFLLSHFRQSYLKSIVQLLGISMKILYIFFPSLCCHRSINVRRRKIEESVAATESTNEWRKCLRIPYTLWKCEIVQTFHCLTSILFNSTFFFCSLVALASLCVRAFSRSLVHSFIQLFRLFTCLKMFMCTRMHILLLPFVVFQSLTRNELNKNKIVETRKMPSWKEKQRRRRESEREMAKTT